MLTSKVTDLLEIHKARIAIFATSAICFALAHGQRLFHYEAQLSNKNLCKGAKIRNKKQELETTLFVTGGIKQGRFEQQTRLFVKCAKVVNIDASALLRETLVLCHRYKKP